MTDDTNILPSDDEDTEGHMPRIRIVAEPGENDTVDTEGHMPYRKELGKPVGENDTEDTEGHVVRNGRIQPADDGEDAEGHALRSGR